jgi:hypothetical protein
VFAQDVHGQMRVFDELFAKDMPASMFAPLLYKHCAERGYFDREFRITFKGDPTGDNRAGTDATTIMQIFRKSKIPVTGTWTNDPDVRIGSVQTQLVTMVDGRPAYLLSPSCTYLVQGKRGGYAWKEDKEVVEKGPFSHPADAEQYAALSMGYGKKLIRNEDARVASQAQIKQRLFDRGGQGVASRKSGLAQRRGVVLSRGS